MEDGSMDKYSDNALLLSLDINSQESHKSALHTYDPDGRSYGTPTTVVITKLSNGDIGWYSYKGAMDPEELDEYIDNAINYESSQELFLILQLAVIAMIVVTVVVVLYLLVKQRENTNV